MKNVLNSQNFSKVAAWLSAALLTVHQLGINIGHVGNTDYGTLAAILLGSAAVHTASNTASSENVK